MWQKNDKSTNKHVNGIEGLLPSFKHLRLSISYSFWQWSHYWCACKQTVSHLRSGIVLLSFSEHLDCRVFGRCVDTCVCDWQALKYCVGFCESLWLSSHCSVAMVISCQSHKWAHLLNQLALHKAFFFLYLFSHQCSSLLHLAVVLKRDSVTLKRYLKRWLCSKTWAAYTDSLIGDTKGVPKTLLPYKIHCFGWILMYPS